MNDFSAHFWGYAIAALSLAGIGACAWLAWAQARSTRRAHEEQLAGQSTGHVWDEDLYELNNPMPRWWLWMFFLTIVFAVGYLVLYPGLGAWQGYLQWSQQGQHDAEKAALDARMEAAYAAFAGKAPAELAEDGRALQVGSSLFLNNCAQCHGSDARGAVGFPNLTAGAWLYGGDADTLRQTIARGRHGMMPPMAQAVGSATDVRNVAAYVLSLSGARTDAAAAARGRPIFQNVCAACHGADGKGNPALGAPDLTDRVWLYGGSQADIIQTITQGREGVMPAHGERLTPQQIDLLVAYVLKASGSAAR